MRLTTCPLLLLSLALPLVASCSTVETRESSASTEARTAPAPPGDLAELLRQYSEATGYNLTYDAATADQLASARIEPVGPAGLTVLLVHPVEVAEAPAELTMHVIRCEYAVAGEMANLLNDLVEDASSGSSDLTITADARTNSLLVQASASDISRVEALVARLDVDLTETP